MSIAERIQQRHFSSLVSEAWVSVVVAADYLTQQTDEILNSHGITGDQYNVLRILRGAQPDGLARGEITERLMRRSPDTTRMLDRLERAGLVERRPGIHDARLSIARITTPGLELLDTVDPEIERVMEEATASLTPAQLRQLAKLCDALVS